MLYARLDTVYTYEAQWDAGVLFGYERGGGFKGYDCSLKSCPSGDDPFTETHINEKHTLTRTAAGGTASLSFGKHSATNTPYTASASTVAAAISALRPITAVVGSTKTGVAVTLSSPATVWCSSAGITVTTVKFLANFVKQPLIQADLTSLTLTSTVNATVVVKRTKTGTKESEVCSNRWLCGETVGTCECSLTSSCPEGCWATSNGYAAAGARGDCGYQATTINDCPGEMPCFGFGDCNPSTYRRTCQAGYSGADCSSMTCAKGPSWFAFPSDDDRAH